MIDRQAVFPEALRLQLAGGFSSLPELMVGLNRQGAMAAYTPLPYMLQALSSAGMMRPLVMAESLAEVDRLRDGFIRLTGFSAGAAGYLFSSFAYAAGLSSDIPGLPSDEGRNGEGGDGAEEPRVDYGRRRPEWDARWSDEEKCRFLTSLIEMNRDNERRLGVKVKSPSCNMVSTYNFRLTAELAREEPGATGALYLAVYDHDGNIADIGAMGVMCYGSVSPLPRAVTVPVAPREVSRLLLYWEYD